MLVIGAGRVGSALKAASDGVGVPCTVITRSAGWEALKGPPGDPIVVTTGCDDLAMVIERTPRHRKEDLVFVQNGMFRALLREHQLPGATRGLLWMAVRARGAPIEPGRPAVFTGPHAREMMRWFITIGIDAEVTDWARFTALELEKLIWNTAFGLLCELYGLDVGAVATERRNELTALVQELARVGRMSTGSEMPLNVLVQRLCDYSATVSTYKASVKDFQWRNGWFLQVAAEHRFQMVLHEELLRAAGHGALLPERPEAAEAPDAADPAEAPAEPVLGADPD